MPNQLTLSDLQSTAKKRGGLCLSTTYQGSWGKHLWQCHRGHRWEAAPGNVRRGDWCPTCAGKTRPDTQAKPIIKIKPVIKAKPNIQNKVWITQIQATPIIQEKSNIRSKAAITLADLQASAQAKGGSCLSETYLGNKVRHRWRCSKGHEWEATPNGVVTEDRWCPKCAHGPQLTLEDLQASARAKGGECLSPDYLGKTIKHRWRCAEGHEWEALVNPIRTGSWCAICAGLKRFTMEELKGIAHAKGGECLSETVPKRRGKILLRCAKGHEWEVRPTALRAGAWCRICASQERIHSIENCKSLAREKGGDFLSAAYLGSQAKHRWRCAKGHEWEAEPVSIRRGTWCPTCARRGPKGPSMADLHAMAHRQGGEFLSETYQGSHTKHLWRCAKGHEWKMIHSYVKAGHWCPTCTRIRGKAEP